MNTTRESPRNLPVALFTMFWAAQAISLFGDRLNNFSLLALINAFSHRPSLTLAYFYLAMSLPLYIVAPFIGAIVDRLEKRWILVITDLSRGVLSCLIPVAFAGSGHGFFPVMAIVFLLAAGNLFFIPAKSALVPELVSAQQLVKINSILWTAGIVGVIGGFLGGGVIFDYFSWAACFYIDGATYFASAALLTGVALSGRAERSAAARAAGARPREYYPRLNTAILDGVRSVRRTPALVKPLGIQSLVYIGAGGFSVLAISLVKEASPGGRSLGLSLAGITIGVGMALGSAIASRFKLGRIGNDRIESAVFLALIPGSAIIFFGSGLPAIVATALVVGFAVSPLVIVAESELQKESHEEMRGRIFAFREILVRTFFIVSAFVFSALGEVVTKKTLLALLGLFLAFVGVIWIRLSRRRMTRAGV
jgi:MFS family permease